MPTTRKNSSADETTLRQLQSEILVVACNVCGRRDELERKAIVKQFTANISIERLRRRLALGCDRMHGLDGVDRCQTKITGKPAIQKEA